MALANYADLKASIATWLMRTDLTAVIPDFVRLAEAQLNRNLNTRQMERYLTLTVTDGQVVLPFDFVSLTNIEFTTGCRRLRYVPPNYLDGLSDQTGDATLYTIQGDSLLFYPAPPDGETLEIRYRQELPPLTQDTDANWLLNSHPDAYLYGALLHSAPYLDDDGRVELWSKFFSAAVEQANLQSAESVSGAFLQMAMPEGNNY